MTSDNGTASYGYRVCECCEYLARVIVWLSGVGFSDSSRGVPCASRTEKVSAPPRRRVSMFIRFNVARSHRKRSYRIDCRHLVSKQGMDAPFFAHHLQRHSASSFFFSRLCANTPEARMSGPSLPALPRHCGIHIRK